MIIRQPQIDGLEPFAAHIHGSGSGAILPIRSIMRSCECLDAERRGARVKESRRRRASGDRNGIRNAGVGVGKMGGLSNWVWIIACWLRQTCLASLI